MPEKRKWMIPVCVLALILLIFWGVYGKGTARNLLSEEKPEEIAVVTEEISADEGPVMKYDAGTHRRAFPMRDPFHMDGIIAARKTGEAVKGNRTSLPSSSASGARSEKPSVSHDPLLKGIMSYKGDRRAVLELDGSTKVVKQGERIGIWAVSSIQEKTVTLSSERGILSLGNP